MLLQYIMGCRGHCIIIIIIIINTVQTAYADEPRGRSTPQKELNNLHTQTIINRLSYILQNFSSDKICSCKRIVKNAKN